MKVAQSIQSLLGKLTDDERAAFDFLIGVARMQPPVPRPYRVTLEAFHRTEKTMVRDDIEIWAYTDEEAMRQAMVRRNQERLRELWALTGDSRLATEDPHVVMCVPATRAEGTE